MTGGEKGHCEHWLYKGSLWTLTVQRVIVNTDCWPALKNQFHPTLIFWSNQFHPTLIFWSNQSLLTLKVSPVVGGHFCPAKMSPYKATDDNTLKPIITLYFQLDFAGCHKSEQTSICRHQTQQQPFANSDSTIVSRIFFMKYVSSRIMWQSAPILIEHFYGGIHVWEMPAEGNDSEWSLFLASNGHSKNKLSNRITENKYTVASPFSHKFFQCALHGRV